MLQWFISPLVGQKVHYKACWTITTPHNSRWLFSSPQQMYALSMASKLFFSLLYPHLFGCTVVLIFCRYYLIYIGKYAVQSKIFKDKKCNSVQQQQRNTSRLMRSGTFPQVSLGPQQSCRKARSGTSLSSSVAAGILALTLEAKWAAFFNRKSIAWGQVWINMYNCVLRLCFLFDPFTVPC